TIVFSCAGPHRRRSKPIKTRRPLSQAPLCTTDSRYSSFLPTLPPDVHIDSRPVDSDSRPMVMTPVRISVAIVHVQPIARLETAGPAEAVIASFVANAVRAGRRGKQSRGSQSRRCGSHERNHAHGVTSSFSSIADNVLQHTWFLGRARLVS